MIRDTEYLGDSVYAEFDGEYVTLTTRNGLPTDPSNIIHLDRSVMKALFDFVQRVNKGG